MQSNNPALRRSAEFSANSSQTGYTDPASWGTGEPGQPGSVQAPVATGGPMTTDSVVQKTAISVGLVMVVAAVTWYLTPDITNTDADLGPLVAAMTIGSLGAFALSLVNSFKRVV